MTTAYICDHSTDVIGILTHQRSQKGWVSGDTIDKKDKGLSSTFGVMTCAACPRSYNYYAEPDALAPPTNVKSSCHSSFQPYLLFPIKCVHNQPN